MVSDIRGKMFPGGGFRGDFEEDPQLQEAIRQLMEASGRDPKDVPEYASGFGGKDADKEENA
jgi:hypothetical protein